MGATLELPVRIGDLRGGTRIDPDGSALSVQWVDLPPTTPALDLQAVEVRYFAWVPVLANGLVGPHWPSGVSGPLVMGFRPRGWLPLIRMGRPEEEARGCLRRRFRPLVGGVLAAPGGEIAFETYRLPQVMRLLVAVRGLRFRLPSPLYTRLQGRVHERSTYAFLREARHELLRGLDAPDVPPA
jgi:hypothetical protein